MIIVFPDCKNRLGYFPPCTKFWCLFCMLTSLPLASYRLFGSRFFALKTIARNHRAMSSSPPGPHNSNVDETSSRTSDGKCPSGGPDRFGLDKTKGVNDLCRRDARVRAEKEAAALDEFSRKFAECAFQDQSSLAAQRHFALQVLLTQRFSMLLSPLYFFSGSQIWQR